MEVANPRKLCKSCKTCNHPEEYHVDACDCSYLIRFESGASRDCPCTKYVEKPEALPSSQARTLEPAAAPTKTLSQLLQELREANEAKLRLASSE